MTISWTSSSLSVSGPRSRSQWLFLENIVIALVPSFIIKFQYNFTQVLGMTIPQISLRFSMIGSRSRSQ